MTTELLTPSEAEAKEDHGKQQAKAQAASVAAMVAALNCDYDRLQELRDEREELAEAVTEAEAVHAEACRSYSSSTHAQNIMREAAAALAAWDDDNAEELNTLEHEAGDCESQEDAQQRIQEDPLSVEVRSGWDVVGGDMSASEFRIVLCTGGPHVEIRGELDQYGAPCRAWMQYQDWGTPLTQYFDIEQSTLLTYCQEFYFGE